MTIKQYAEEMGVSPQSVYQRLKKNKIRVESMTEKGTGELTGEGRAVLDKLYSPENRPTKSSKDEQLEVLNNQVSTIRQENAVLIEKVKRLEAEVSALKEDKDYLSKALEREQMNNADFIKLLPGKVEQQPEKLTWKERFTGRREKR